MQVKPFKKYFNLSSPYKTNVKEYWSDQAMLHRMYDYQTRASYEFCHHADDLGYKVYFFTLTFNNENLPHFYYECELPDRVTNTYKLRTFCLPYFNADIINAFFADLRKHLWRKYGIKDIPFFCAGDYGKKKRRPHYHCLIALPGILTPQEVLDLIKKYWSRQVYDELTGKRVFENGEFKRESYGFVLPSRPEGWTDRTGHVHLPLEIESARIPYATKYAAKYALKSVSTGKQTPEEKFLTQCINESSDSVAMAEWKRGQARVKTSLNFGKAIDDIILKSSDPLSDLYYGFKDLRVNSEKLVQVPLNNVRRLLHRNVLMKKEIVNIPESGYAASATIFLDFTPIGRTKTYYRYKSEYTPLGVRFRQYSIPLNALALRDHFLDTLTKISRDHQFKSERKSTCFDSLLEKADDFASFKMCNALAYYKLCYQNCVDYSYYSDRDLLPAGDWFIPESTTDLDVLIAKALKFKTQFDSLSATDFKECSIDPCNSYYGKSRIINSFPAFSWFDAILALIDDYDKVKDVHYSNVVRQIVDQSEAHQDLTEELDSDTMTHLLDSAVLTADELLLKINDL